jgi:peroxiredoxin
MTSPEYRFDRFKRQFILEDLGFHAGPRPGEPFPEFELTTVDGGTVSRGDFIEKQPMLMIFSSFT